MKKNIYKTTTLIQIPGGFETFHKTFCKNHNSEVSSRMINAI